MGGGGEPFSCLHFLFIVYSSSPSFSHLKCDNKYTNFDGDLQIRLLRFYCFKLHGYFITIVALTNAASSFPLMSISLSSDILETLLNNVTATEYSGYSSSTWLISILATQC